MYPSLDIDFTEEFVSPHSPETLARLVYRDEDSHSKMVDLVPTGYRFHDLVLWHPRSV
jgi:hypothetical protein